MQNERTEHKYDEITPNKNIPEEQEANESAEEERTKS